MARSATIKIVAPMAAPTATFQADAGPRAHHASQEKSTTVVWWTTAVVAYQA
jgi:hypothetical protein